MRSWCPSLLIIKVVVFLLFINKIVKFLTIDKQDRSVVCYQSKISWCCLWLINKIVELYKSNQQERCVDYYRSTRSWCFYCRLSVYKIAVLFMIDQQEFGYLLLSINKIVVMVTIDQQDRNVVSEWSTRS